MNLIEKVYNEMSTDADGNEKQAKSWKMNTWMQLKIRKRQ